MIKIVFFLIVFFEGFGQFFAGISNADDALVLPKGVSRVSVDSIFYFPVEKRFDPNGKVERIDADYNRPLDSRLFPALALLDPLLGRRASIGDSEVAFRFDRTDLHLGFFHGVTDQLTAGIDIPYTWGKNKVKARLNSGPGSSANVGLNPLFGTPGQPPVIPLALGGIPLSTEDAQKLLGPGLPGIPGFGLKPVETWSDEGFGDIEAGVRYQYLRTEDWRLAFTGGLRFPTGRVDDPDNLVDFDFGSGAYALLFRFNQDYVLSNLWQGPRPRGAERAAGEPPPGTLVLNGTFRFDLVLPDRELKRVPSDVNNPITPNKEKVKRDLGDRFEFEVSGKYTLLRGFHVSSLYKYGFKLEDRISGNKGFAYESLEDETARTEHVYILGVSYTTTPLYLEKQFPLPLTASLSYRNRFAGSNNILKTQYIGAELKVFF